MSPFGVISCSWLLCPQPLSPNLERLSVGLLPNPAGLRGQAREAERAPRPHCRSPSQEGRMDRKQEKHVNGISPDFVTHLVSAWSWGHGTWPDPKGSGRRPARETPRGAPTGHPWGPGPHSGSLGHGRFCSRKVRPLDAEAGGVGVLQRDGPHGSVRDVVSDIVGGSLWELAPRCWRLRAPPPPPWPPASRRPGKGCGVTVQPEGLRTGRARV